MHKSHEPDALVDLLYADVLAGEDGAEVALDLPRQDVQFFLSTSSAAASASAFSLRASSRSSWRMRLVVAVEAAPPSSMARRHCSYSASFAPLTFEVGGQLLTV